jgi:gliding motility-associated-like protein
MKYIVITLSVLLASSTLHSQTWRDVTNDFIVNPSFEIYNYCPDSGLTLYGISSCLGWYRPTIGTSDYYHPCGASGTTTTPAFWGGYQIPYHGNAYVGFHGKLGDSWAEYIQSELLNPLRSNNRYRYSMRVNRADYNGSTCLSNIGTNFSQTDMQNFTTSASYNIVPSVFNTSGYLCDTANWMLVSGEFIAQGGEEYITIGWFGDSYLNDFTIYTNYTLDSLTGDTLYVASNYYLVDSLKLFVLEYNLQEFEINVFSPNGDGTNDYIEFSGYELKQLDFKVYNRWGNVVFNSNNTNLRWDGLDNDGKLLSDGTYYYILEATTAENTVIIKHNTLSIFY